MASDLPDRIPGRPSRPSELVMNPQNDDARAERRAQLLKGFRRLSLVEQADLIEAVEALASRHGVISQVDPYRTDLRLTVKNIWRLGGLD